MKIIRTDNNNIDLKNLIRELDAYLKVTDGSDHDFYNQFNGLEKIKNAVVLYNKNEPIGCGAFREFNEEAIEIKRMYVKPSQRGTRAASKILKELEDWANELGFKKSILETGERQVEAVKFYHKSGYKRIPNYGQYTQMDNSCCFQKILG